MEPRKALVTGASAGIGRALAHRLARDGMQVVLCARREEQLKELADEIASAGGQAHVLPLDVSDTEATQSALLEIDESLGGIDVVVANAGIAKNRRAPKQRWSDIDSMVGVNILGAAATLTALLPRMLERKVGHLVGISSLVAVRPMPGMAVYSATKAFLSHYLEGLRIDLQGKGITVTDVQPGFVESEMTDFYKQKGQALPFMISTERAADIIADAIESRQNAVSFPWQLSAMVKGANLMPERVWSSGIRRVM